MIETYMPTINNLFISRNKYIFEKKTISYWMAFNPTTTNTYSDLNNIWQTSFWWLKKKKICIFCFASFLCLFISVLLGIIRFGTVRYGWQSKLRESESESESERCGISGERHHRGGWTKQPMVKAAWRKFKQL